MNSKHFHKLPRLNQLVSRRKKKRYAHRYKKFVDLDLLNAQDLLSPECSRYRDVCCVLREPERRFFCSKENADCMSRYDTLL